MEPGPQSTSKKRKRNQVRPLSVFQSIACSDLLGDFLTHKHTRAVPDQSSTFLEVGPLGQEVAQNRWGKQLLECSVASKGFLGEGHTVLAGEHM